MIRTYGPDWLRAVARATLPRPLRRFLRRAAREAPYRIRDLPRDAVCLVAPRAFGGPLPPPGLRARVGLPSRSEFTFVGREGSRQILAAVEAAAEPGRTYPRWLDFGCGCGRIARHLADDTNVESLAGVDVDAELVGWAARNLRGSFSVIRPEPPLRFADASFDVVLAVSIFTHLSEIEQFVWLEELRRVLAPGGLLLATTLSPDLAPWCPGLTDEDHRALAAAGFLAVNRGGTFNERSTFHARAYLEHAWSSRFRFRFHQPRGFVSYQDLSVWEKTAAGSAL